MDILFICRGKMIIKNLLFIHIPRTVGTYIENLICSKFGIRSNWPNPDMEILFGLMKCSESNYFVLQHLTYIESVKFVGKIPSFSVVRNPYDRALSLYRYWGGDNRFGSLSIFLNQLEEINLDEYEYEGIKTSNPNFNFKNMTDNISECKYHFLPQYKYVCENGKIMC